MIKPMTDFVERHYRHNFIFNFLDGATFWFGYSFIAQGVILPLFVSHLTSNKLVIGLVAMISATGFFFPQLFTANAIERRPIKRDVVVKIGLFTERLPIWLLPLSALLALKSPLLALILFLLLLAWHNFGAGMIAVAWQDMLAKVFPVERRGFFLGLTTFAGNATGVFGASLASWILYRYTFPTGYAICFALAGLFIFFSWASLAQTRELPQVHESASATAKDYWRKLGGILRSDTNLRNFLFSQALIGLGGMAWGFLAVYTVDQWRLPDGVVSQFTAALLIGQAVGNLIFGPLGDKLGYRMVIIISVVFSILSLVLAYLAPAPGWCYLVFVLRGVALGGGFVAMLFILEFCQPDVRPTYIGVANTTIGIFGTVAPLIGGWLAQTAGYSPLFVVSTIVTVTGLAWTVGLVKEPRKLNLSRHEAIEVKPQTMDD